MDELTSALAAAGQEPRRPLVTFFLFAYNQQAYVAEACRAALAQTYSPLEIIFSDDFSSDATYDEMKRVAEDYRGPHRIRLNRNEKNLGVVGHVNSSFEISSGELIVAAAGDDISMPHRVESIVEAYQNTGALVIHSSALTLVDADAPAEICVPPVVEHNMSLSDIAESSSLYIGATGAWSKAMYAAFGPLRFEHAYEDLVFGFRAAISASLIYVDNPLVRYRRGVGISAKQIPPLFDFAGKVRTRMKETRVERAVFAQRLADLTRVDDSPEARLLRQRIARRVMLCEERQQFYNSPSSTLVRLLSREFGPALGMIAREIRYLLGAGTVVRRFLRINQ